MSQTLHTQATTRSARRRARAKGGILSDDVVTALQITHAINQTIINQTIAEVTGNILRRVGEDTGILEFMQELRSILDGYPEGDVETRCVVLQKASKPIYGNIRTKADMLRMATSLSEAMPAQSAPAQKTAKPLKVNTNTSSAPPAAPIKPAKRKTASNITSPRLKTPKDSADPTRKSPSDKKLKASPKPKTTKPKAGPVKKSTKPARLPTAVERLAATKGARRKAYDMRAI